MLLNPSYAAPTALMSNNRCNAQRGTASPPPPVLPLQRQETRLSSHTLVRDKDFIFTSLQGSSDLNKLQVYIKRKNIPSLPAPTENLPK